MVPGLILGGRNICITIYFNCGEKTDHYSLLFFDTAFFAQEWMRLVVFHLSSVCLAFFSFLCFLLGRSLNEQLPS